METLSNFFVIHNYNGGFSFFWTSPLGFLVCLTLFITSVYKIFSEGTGFILSVFEYLMAFCAAAALLHIYENSVPKHQMVTMIVTIALKSVYETYINWRHK